MTDIDAEFRDFVVHRSAALLRTAYLLTGGDRGAAEDLLQDVLERVYVKRRRLQGTLEPYVRTALANAAVNRWRHRSRRVTETQLHAHHEAGAAGPESGVADRDQLLWAMAQLPLRMRAVVVLRYFEDMSAADTAAALGCGVGTVKSQTARGLDRLRDLLATESLTQQESIHGHH
jgi:RNA polymerase sigma-70 factor (sigma-E family)